MRSLLLAVLAATLTLQDKTTADSTNPDVVIKEFKVAYNKAGKDDRARASAVRDLGRAPHAKTLSTLGTVLLGSGGQTEVQDVRIAAAETIGDKFAAIPNAWSPLATCARVRDRKIAEVRIQSVKAMGKLADPKSLRALQEFIDDKPFEMAAEAVDALAVVRDKSSVPMLIKLLREVERTTEDEVIPGLPFHGLGAGGVVVDDARAEQNNRRKTLLGPVQRTLTSLTGQELATYKEYQKWWSANGSKLQVEGKKR